MSGAESPEKIRHAVGRLGRQLFDEAFIREMLEEIKGMTKPVRVDYSCPSCDFRKTVLVDIPDVKGRLEAWTKLMAEMEGKPGTDAGDTAGMSIVVHRPAR